MNSSLGLFPLNTVLMPGAALRLHVFEDRYKALMAQCITCKLPFGVLLDRHGKETGEDLDPVQIGTTAVIREVSKLSAGRLYVIASGVQRFRLHRILEKTPFWRATVSYLDESSGKDAAMLRALALERFRDYLEALLAGCSGELDSIDLPADAALSSYIIADALQIGARAKQMLLEAPNASQRLRAEIVLLEEETQRLRALRLRAAPEESSAQLSAFTARFSRN